MFNNKLIIVLLIAVIIMGVGVSLLVYFYITAKPVIEEPVAQTNTAVTQQVPDKLPNDLSQPQPPENPDQEVCGDAKNFSAQAYDACLKLYAQNYNRYEYCDLIKDRNIKQDCLDNLIRKTVAEKDVFRCFEYTDFQTECVSRTLLLLADETVCDKLTDVKQKEFCLSKQAIVSPKL